jgi:hypothetical protein
MHIRLKPLLLIVSPLLLLIAAARIIAARVQALGGENVLPLKLSEVPPESANRAEVTDLEANDERAGDDAPVDRSHMTQRCLRRWLGF